MPLRPHSPWGFAVNLRRVLWSFAYVLLFRFSFHDWYGWRRLVLRAFGARVGRGARVRPSVRIEMPWNVEIGERSIVGDYAILYALGSVTIGADAVISQYAHLCAGTHDYTSRYFPVICSPITVGEGVWIAADSFIGPGVTVGRFAVVGARSNVFADVPEGVVVAGSPARFIKVREMHD